MGFREATIASQNYSTSALQEWPLSRKLDRVGKLGDLSRRAVSDLHDVIRAVPKGANLITEGERSDHIYIVVSGWAARYRLTSSGKRQILNFMLPGDLVGLMFCTLRKADHSVCAITDLRIACLPQTRFEALAFQYPDVFKAIHWTSACEWAMICEHLVDLGRRSATHRIAHLLLELRSRLTLIDHGSCESFYLPITQEMIADFTGLTHVHVSRSLRKLCELGLLHFERNHLTVVDYERLAVISDFSDRILPAEPVQQ